MLPHVWVANLALIVLKEYVSINMKRKSLTLHITARMLYLKMENKTQGYNSTTLFYKLLDVLLMAALTLPLLCLA